MAPVVRAGGPRAVNGVGQPMAWNAADPIVYHVDAGPLGLLNNAAARALLAEAFAVWAGGPADITFVEGAPLALDVNAVGFAYSHPAHFQNFYRVDGDGKSPVIFDHDGSIIDALFGLGARYEILGVAGLDTPIGTNATITGASIIINGAFHDGVGQPASPEDLSLEGIRATMVHEIGHFINLDHSVLNHEMAFDGNAGNDIYVPTMFPLAVLDEGALASTHMDDEMAALNLYPSGSGTLLSGTVSAAGVPFQGANVVFRDADDPLGKAFSMISGGLYFPCNPGSTCDPCSTACNPGNPAAQGAFAMDLLTLSDAYKVCVEQIDTRFSEFNGTFVGPLASQAILSGPEECIDMSESALASDNPDQWRGVTVGEGPVTLELNAMPVESDDAFEPNNGLEAGATLGDLVTGYDTVAGFLSSGDLDVYDVPVFSGQRVRVDLDAAELGSPLDAVVGFYDDANNLLAISDDAVDPDSEGFSRDPALEIVASFDGVGKIVVSSFPDLDLNGSGGASTGGYWLKVERLLDSDGDGASDPVDVCSEDPRDDEDHDGVCFLEDTCPTRANVSQSVPATLNGSLTAGGAVDRAEISPDGSLAVYRASQDTAGVLELYRVLLAGGTSVKLNTPLASGRQVSDFRISPDGARVVYLADESSAGVFELFSVPMGGGSPVTLSGSMPGTGDVTSFAVSPDGAWVVYIADSLTDETFSLFSVPADGTAAAIALWQATGTRDATSFRIGPDSQRVVYRADDVTDEQFELSSIPIGGGAATHLNGFLGTDGDVREDYGISPDGSRVVYTVEYLSEVLSETFDTQRNGVPGFQWSRLPLATDPNDPLRALGDPNDDVLGYTMSGGPSPQGTAGIVCSDDDQGFVGCQAPVEEENDWHLHSPFEGPGAGYDVFGHGPGIGAPDGGKAHSGFRSMHMGRHLSPSTTLGDTLRLRQVSAFVLDSQGDPDIPGVPLGSSGTLEFWHMISVPDDENFGNGFIPPGTSFGGGQVQVSLLGEDARFSRWERLTPSSNGYDTVLQEDLSVCGFDPTDDDIVPSDETMCDNSPLFADKGDVFGTDATCTTDTDNNDAAHKDCGDISCVPGSGCTENGSIGSGVWTRSGFGLSSFAGRVVRLRWIGMVEGGWTFATQRSMLEPDPGGSAYQYYDGDDGWWIDDIVVSDRVTELYSVPVGGGAAVKLNDALSPGGNVQSFRIAPDGSRVVYLADQDSAGDQELYSVATIGGAATRLNGDLAAGGRIESFTIAPNGSRVVYMGDQDVPGSWELYSVSLAGGSPVKLNGPPGGDNYVLAYSVTPDSGMVVFQFRQPPDFAERLYATPLTGGVPVTLSSGAVLDYGFTITSDSAYALYTLSQTGDLHSVPVRGGRSTRLNGSICNPVYPVVPVAPTGSVVVYLSEPCGSGAELHRVDAASGPDSDGDTMHDGCDSCVGFANPQQDDADGNGVGDACQACASGTDPDADNVCSAADNCVTAANTGQEDFDSDGAGDACDADDDNDGLADEVETSTGVFVDGNNTGTNPRDADTDDDGKPDGEEVAAGTNPTQLSSVVFSLSQRRMISSMASGAGSIVAGDLDGDGRADLVSASQNDDTIAWHRNEAAGGFGARQLISTSADSARSVFTADLDKDGDLDVLSASFDDDTIAWYENQDGLGTFGPEQVISLSADGANVVSAADLDRDGDMDVVSGSSLDGKIAWYENTDGAGTFSPQNVISTAAGGASSLVSADFDRDGDADLLSSSSSNDWEIAWYRNDGGGAFSGQIVISTLVPNAQEASAADLDQDGDLDVLSASFNDDKIAWYENTDGAGTFGAQQVLSSQADMAQGVRAADLDEDGDLDVISVAFTGTISWAENRGGSDGFGPLIELASAGVGGTSIIAVDIDQDADLDVVSTALSGDTIAWYENRMVHRSATFPTSSTISTAASRPYFLSLADVEGDGDLDVMSASYLDDRIAWHENDGMSPPGWTMRTITTNADGTEAMFAADLDGDGDVDALAASYEDDTVAWYRSDGASPPGWTEQVISTTADGAWGVTAADLDGDGDLDVISSSQFDNKLAWYENDGSVPPLWTERVISGVAPWKRGVATGDLDHDGRIDVLATLHSGLIAWYRNEGGSPPTFTAYTMDPSAGVGNAPRVGVADVDGDGDTDAYSAAYTGSLIAWFENDGAPLPSFTQRSIPTGGPTHFPISAADLDLDGDVDLMSGAGSTTQRVSWWENDGSGTPAWTEHLLTTSNPQPTAIVAGDIDGDGDADIVTANGASPSSIQLWENRGGHFALTTTSLAPGILADGATAPLLSIQLAHRGRGGDNPVELAALELRMVDGLGAPLSSEQGNRLIERLRVHLDTGSGVFEPGQDPSIVVIDTLQLSPQRIDFVHGDPRVRVAPGQERKLFVVAEFSPAASQSGIASFRLQHDTRSQALGRDASSGALVRVETPGIAASSLILTQPDAVAPSVTSVFPADHSVDVSPSTSVVLFFTELVDPSSAASGVALYAGAVKVPATVNVKGTVVSLHPDARLAEQSDFQIQVSGLLTDLAGNPAQPFAATFDTAASATVATIDAGDIGGGAGGKLLSGTNTDDNSGFATAALGDVNASEESFGIADLIIGAPNADAGAVDAGQATLVFGEPGLQSNAGAVLSLTYRTGMAQEFVGETVAYAGDLNGDTVKDILIGAPHSDRSSADAGMVYLVFGNPGLDELSPATLDLDDLAACAVPTLCGVIFQGAAAGDRAGASLSWAGDVNGDGDGDLLIGAPGANSGAGAVYLIYGPLTAGTRSLSQVGSTVPGLVFRGEVAGDRLGEAVSSWTDGNGDGLDDLLLGAPGATALNLQGAPVPVAGYVYAIQGGTGPGRLDDNASPGVIQVSRVANGLPDQVAGMVFIGESSGGELGRSLTGAVDFDGNGTYDILIAADGVAYAIPGDDPKTRVGSSSTGGTTGGGTGLRTGQLQALRDLGALRFIAAPGEPLTVGAAGDLNRDGIDDFIIGSPLADGAAGIDAGRAYIVLGSPAPVAGDRYLEDIGETVDGFVVEGAQAGDRLGASVSGGFDLNGDGADDALVGAPFADTDPATPANAGEAYVISPVRPGEVRDLTLDDAGGGITRLEWAAPGLASAYNVYRGSLAVSLPAQVIRTSDMAQLACGYLADADGDLRPDYDEIDTPPLAGEALFYLVTAENLLGEGPLGPPGLVPARVNDLQCP